MELTSALIRLANMVEEMKGAVGMKIELRERDFCAISLYSRNGDTRRERLQLTAATMSSEQSGTRTTGDSVWLAFERYDRAFFRYLPIRKPTFFHLAGHDRTSQDLIVRKLGLSIAQNANSVEFLHISAENGDGKDGFAKQLLSLDAWKEAFPSLQGACLSSDPFNDAIDVSPHLRKHVRSVALVNFGGSQMITPGYLDLIGSMIRKKVIEEISIDSRLLCHTKLLDDTLRSVRSLVVTLSVVASTTALDALARSFERTKAEGDKLERLSVGVHCIVGVPVWTPENSFSATAVKTIIRSRPNLQVLEVKRIHWRDLVGVCQAVASSTLIAFKCNCAHLSSPVEDGVAIVGELMQHSTIRDLEFIVTAVSSDANAFVEGVAEGLRATRLRRFHLTMSGHHEVSMDSMTKVYESVRENRSLMDIQLKGGCFWALELRFDLPREPPCPLRFFGFLSSRNQYLSQLPLPYEYSLPAGLWPLILESASSDASILYFLLTLQPHLVEGMVEGAVAADREWGVDGSARKCRRIA